MGSWVSGSAESLCDSSGIEWMLQSIEATQHAVQGPRGSDSCIRGGFLCAKRGSKMEEPIPAAEVT